MEPPRKEKEKETGSADGTQDHLRIASLQHIAVLLPRKTKHLSAFVALEPVPQGAHISHCLLGRPAASLEDEWHQFAARGWVA